MRDLLEDLSLKAWPPEKVISFPGGRLGLSMGYTKRANHCQLFTIEHLEDKIELAENYYEKAGLTPTFRIYDQAGSLAEVLAGQGYKMVDPSLVMTLALEKGQSLDLATKIYQEAGPWLAAYEDLSGKREAGQIELFKRTPPGSLYLLHFDHEKVVAAGYGAITGPYLGLYNIFTHRNERKKGYGKQVIKSLLSLGYEKGCRLAYLQVVKENKGAQRLYEQLGFRTSYEYAYMVKK